MTLPTIRLIEPKDLTPKQAEKITTRIKSSMRDMIEDIAKAHIGRVWIGMGYDTWQDWVAGEFEYAPLHLPRAERKAVTQVLRGQGMSTRAIAAVTGVDQKTVVNDQRPGEENSSPDLNVEILPPIAGLDGKTYTPPTPKADVPQPAARTSIPGSQKDKLERAKLAMRKEFERKLTAELNKHIAKLEEDLAAHKAAFDEQRKQQNKWINERRDAERKRYQEGIEVQRANGIISPDDFDRIRSCLHPDSRNSVSDEKLADAFRVFNDSRVKTLLVREEPKRGQP